MGNTCKPMAVLFQCMTKFTTNKKKINKIIKKKVKLIIKKINSLMLLLLCRFSRGRLCATPQTAALQAPPSVGFSRQEHCSGLPFPSPMHKSEKWKWSRSVVSDSQPSQELQSARLLQPWDFPGKSTGVGCHCLLQNSLIVKAKSVKTEIKVKIKNT